MSLVKIDKIDWSAIEHSKVDPTLVSLAKTASVVEFNSADYIQYLLNVFDGDDEFCHQIKIWGEEERGHGLVMKTWVQHVDPTFDFEWALSRFRKAFQVPVDSQVSIRGSRAREMVARCLVESGTTSYYAALADASQEPVFKKICQLISADEIRHYKLFYKTLLRYANTESISKWERLKVAWERTREVEDDELALAYASANLVDEEVDRSQLPRYNRLMLSKAYGAYRPRHLQRGISLAMQAAGFKANSLLSKAISTGAYGMLKYRQRKLIKEISNVASA